MTHFRRIKPLLNGNRYYSVNSGRIKSAELEQEVLKVLNEIIEPCTNTKLRNCNLLHSINVNESNYVDITFDYKVSGYPYKQKIQNECLENIQEKLKWNSGVKFSENKLISSQKSLGAPSALHNVQNIIGVSSCKGGVGKSTLSINLARALNKNGLKVGVLDADIYGPSLPFLVEADDITIRKSANDDKMIEPIEDNDGLKVLSFGYVNPKAGAPGAGGRDAAVMRGPIVSRVINQLITCTEWGDLDYLIVDLPPGTGDIQITLSQTLCMTGVVVVTTPHLLSVADVAKGIEMFRQLKVPTLSLVENMSYFKCKLGNVYHPFGKGGKEKLIEKLNLLSSSTVVGPSDTVDTIKKVTYHSLPLRDKVAEAENGGMNVEEQFKSIAEDMVAELFRQRFSAEALPDLRYETQRGLVLRYFSSTEASEYVIPSYELRWRDPLTGRRLPQSRATSTPIAADGDEVQIVDIDQQGHYGVRFFWNDGHSGDIFPYDILRSIAEECREKYHVNELKHS